MTKYVQEIKKASSGPSNSLTGERISLLKSIDVRRLGLLKPLTAPSQQS